MFSKKMCMLNKNLFQMLISLFLLAECVSEKGDSLKILN